MHDKTSIKLLAGGLLVAASPLTLAAVPDSCRSVDFAEVGWTDITATTALASEVLQGLGYEAGSDTVSVPIAYSGMKNGDFDVFLGNWMPSMASMRLCETTRYWRWSKKLRSSIVRSQLCCKLFSHFSL